ncbi:MAG: hypothetical protein GX567_16675 [Clostridia bacterium]|nr:hypothetical protein [Clostridia bacterium]
MMKRIKKGQYGYLKTQRRIEILKTILLFGCSFLILFLGIYMTKSKMNLFTVVAILGILPASKSAVGMIMFLRFKLSSDELYQAVKETAGPLKVNYDLVVTSQENAVQINAVACCANTICGYVENKKADVKKTEAHIDTILKNNHISHCSIKLYQDFPTYLTRITEMKDKLLDTPNENQIVSDETKPSEDDQILSLLQAISI